MSARKRLFLLFSFLIVGVTLCFLLWPFHLSEHKGATVNLEPSGTPSDVALPYEKREAATKPPRSDIIAGKTIDAWTAAFAKPFSFIGRVVDESGKPVQGATASWSANDNPNWGPMAKSGGKGIVITDAQGRFSFNAKGIGVYVEVSKEGYYRVPTSLAQQKVGSYAGFSNADKIGKSDLPIPTSTSPAVFVLRGRGQAADLVYLTERPVKVPKNGVPVEIALETGKIMTPGQGDLRIECWTEDQQKDAEGRYPWRCRVSVPGGGLTKRKDQYDFEAPTDGYENQDDITPSEEHWSSTAERQYFVKTADNHFVRVNLRMRTGGEHFVVIESYFNPQPGSRNLEYDPSKQAAAR